MKRVPSHAENARARRRKRGSRGWSGRKHGRTPRGISRRHRDTGQACDDAVNDLPKPPGAGTCLTCPRELRRARCPPSARWLMDMTPTELLRILLRTRRHRMTQRAFKKPCGASRKLILLSNSDRRSDVDHEIWCNFHIISYNI